MTDCVLLRREGPVVHLRFNRPQSLNAIDANMARTILAVSNEIAADRSVRAVVMSGEGKGFMAGGDLASMAAQPDAIATDIIDPLHTALRVLASIDAPVIASVHGVVAGAGIGLMLAADFAVAAEGTRFNLAYINIGTSCDGGASFALPRVVGLRRAMEIALLSEPFDAGQALQWSIVNRVVPTMQLEAETHSLAERLASGPTRAIGHMRRLMRGSFDGSFAAQLDAEREAFDACTGSADFSEGVQAFFAKRGARFQGC
jgi:2-(1,2-epoxy-1,2-dihydrophenyl)acetyl-CoA isomerase